MSVVRCPSTGIEHLQPDEAVLDLKALRPAGCRAHHGVRLIVLGERCEGDTLDGERLGRPVATSRCTGF
jgi:hypothetical protein